MKFSGWKKIKAVPIFVVQEKLLSPLERDFYLTLVYVYIGSVWSSRKIFSILPLWAISFHRCEEGMKLGLLWFVFWENSASTYVTAAGSRIRRAYELIWVLCGHSLAKFMMKSVFFCSCKRK